ncbi:hypothetical protein N7539_007016 [Penicillium diatomitis]|uniref:Major facilitator superfamily (MFS) profile domain-containing protein n=1 Tax=Penicillium diatomitis TaxID=2819901 RepID=A0A9W9X2Y3_9EURO|nr:uncharacterized protein N7539_007016 [Penicillium diatomitis]KAJ5481122.1 hypothetical protein N7539_007016 [Penicillium diatomitis]
MADDISRGNHKDNHNHTNHHHDRIDLDVEKERIESCEHVVEMQNPNVVPHIDPARRAVVEKSLMRKLDARCSLFVLIYIMNYLDRNNISAARLKGLQKDLSLTDTQYSTCLSILYVGYILMQVPSNMFINRIQRPSLYIAVSMTLWGLISTCSGLAGNFGHMVAIRFLLGFVEAAFLPGALLILSKWYTRRELTTRNALLFCGNLISNAFSSLVAAGVLSNMEGTLGHAAWRWLFWIEGAVTMTIAISAAFILPDLPTNSRGFTEEELLVAQLRILEDVGEADTDSEEQSAFSGLIMALKDFKIYLMMLAFTAYVIGLSFNAFFPTLTGTLGFSYVPTLLMSAPPWVFSCLFSVLNAWHADRTQEKLLLPATPAKRAVALALINAFSQLGNVAGSYVWDLKENGYRKSYGIVTAMYGVTMIGFWLFRMILVNLNTKLEKQEMEWDAEHPPAQGQQGRGAHGAGDGNVVFMDSADESLQMRKGFRYLI